MMDSSDTLRKWLCCLENCFAQLDRPAEAQRAAMLATSIDLKRPITIVVVGEFNAGKSTLVNALCGMDVLPAGIIPTTATVNVVGYSPSEGIQVRYADGSSRDLAFSRDAVQQFTARNGDQSQVREVHITTPSVPPDLVLIDTPGVNDINQTRSEIVYGTLPEADIILFLMDIQQPLKRSEVDFLRSRILGTSLVKTIFALNHIDRVSSEAEVSAAVEFVRNGIKSIYTEVAKSFARTGAHELASELESAAIPIFRISAKRMLRSIGSSQSLDGDPDGLQSELMRPVSPEAKLETLLSSVCAQIHGLASKLQGEIGERLTAQEERREETLKALTKNTERLRRTWEASRKALSKIEAERTILNGEADSAIAAVFKDAQASVADRLKSAGIEHVLQLVQQELARNLESRLAVLNGRIQNLAIDCAQQISLEPINSGNVQNMQLGALDAPQQQKRDWLADLLNDPVKGAAFWVLAPAVPFLFGPIGFVLVALPFVARLFTADSSDSSTEQIQSQLAKSCEQLKSTLHQAVDDRLNLLSMSLFEGFDDIQGRIRTCCGVISGKEGIDRAELQSLKSAVDALQADFAQAMTSVRSERRSRPGLFSGEVKYSTTRTSTA